MTTEYIFRCERCLLHKRIAAPNVIEARAAASRAGWSLDPEQCSRCSAPPYNPFPEAA